jgi:TRAP-type C4-dicarboxylate transport system permease small subunit
VIARLRAAAGAADVWVRRAEFAVIGTLTGVMTLITLAQVVMRYVFNDSLIWSEEAVRYLFVWVSLVAAGAAVGQGAHYGLEAAHRYLPPQARATLGFVAMLIVAAFALALLVTGVREAMLAARQFSWTMPIRMHWAYSALPVGAALMLWHIGVLWLRHGLGRHPLDRD